ncbi:S-adenosyl-L-methionine-dependent methyltransferase [Raphidocelis subcapitata]|uniref:S-adenosyl-L-methionine-dependent methyltransferase n=1 Tax=Raphidocelis subcapitata TaxID=307507 RepID=A0A2V0P3H4_9CHLO|nr:S-adenosyl-L-methionine-dependent methyltransferase [Raphidocelis subcapitata]|eukprot:GBF92403.1 S-adenosyl-L-methionine-dependent methyltransferase [Raphidocelis subcapitata]
MRLSVSTILAGGAVYAGATYATYKFLTKPAGLDAADGGGAGGAGGCAFDRLAAVYDSTVGSEETYMMYGLMRWWMLRGVKGDVLEISAGTGRNLPHYPWGKIRSLTLADVSAPMLAVAESKYFEDLQINLKHPDHGRARFVLADAERMVAPEGEAPVEVPLRQPRGPRHEAQRAGSSGGSGSGGGGSGGTEAAAGGEEGRDGGGAQAWRLWRRPGLQQQRAAGELSSGRAEAAAAGSEKATAAAAAASGDAAAEGAGSAPPSPFGGFWRKRKGQEPGVLTSSSTQGDASPAGDASAAAWPAPPPPPPAIAARPPCSCSGVPAGGAAAAAAAAEGGAALTTFPPRSFDFVVDTFGLCSCDDPVQALRQGAALLRPGGRLVLLEHGRSSAEWLNARMDAAAAAHRAKWGCWWNRDIEGIVREAGLDVETSWRWHVGTTYAVVARPCTAADAAAAGGPAAADADAAANGRSGGAAGARHAAPAPAA